MLKEVREFSIFHQEIGHEECCGPTCVGKIYATSIDDAYRQARDYDGYLYESEFSEGILVDPETHEYIDE